MNGMDKRGHVRIFTATCPLCGVRNVRSVFASGAGCPHRTSFDFETEEFTFTPVTAIKVKAEVAPREEEAI